MIGITSLASVVNIGWTLFKMAVTVYTQAKFYLSLRREAAQRRYRMSAQSENIEAKEVVEGDREPENLNIVA